MTENGLDHKPSSGNPKPLAENGPELNKHLSAPSQQSPFHNGYSNGFVEPRKTYSGHSTFPSLGSREGSVNSSLNNLLDVDDSNSEDGDNVNVCIRTRPLSNKEIQEHDNEVIHFPGNGQIIVDKVEKVNGNKPKNFTFNVVFEPQATQNDVFEHSGVKNIIEMALDGYSCTVFAYGQTGSGKTYTLAGPPLPHGKVSNNPKTSGLMQHSFHYLFQQLAGRKNNNYSIHASFLEIYNEQVIDLLNVEQRKYLTVRWAKDKGFYVENLFIVPCFEEDDILAVMEEGLQNRQVAANYMNETSSRSHCILTLNITSEIKDPDEENVLSKHGRIIFVDLAGSEKVTEKNTSQGSLNETNKINRSLLTLGKCISALGDSKKKTGHIPYRDSQLTKLLKDSLGGNGVTLMVACISPSKSNLSETLNTLYYAVRTKKIKNQPHIVMDPKDQLIVSLKREVKMLKSENQYLKEQLQFPKIQRSPSAPQPAKNLVVLEKLQAGLDTGQFPSNVSVKEVHSLVKDYVAENESLREENSDLLHTKEFLIRDHELVVRENEKLLKKLDTFERGARRSPGASSSSGSISGLSEPEKNPRSNVRGSPNLSRPPAHLSYPTRPPHRLPESISKELQRRRIGEDGINGPSRSNDTRSRSRPRRNSWDNGTRARRSSPATSQPKKQTASSNLLGPVRRSESDQHLRGTEFGNNAKNSNNSNPSSKAPHAFNSPKKPHTSQSPHREQLLRQGDPHESNRSSRSN